MALKANIIIDQGTDYSTIIDITDDNGDPIDLTDYTGSAYIRKHFSSSTHYAFDTVTCYANGSVKIAMGSVTSANIPAGRYVYDCNLVTSGNTATRIVEGILTVTPAVTRAD